MHAAATGRPVDQLYSRIGLITGNFFPKGWGDLRVVNLEEDLTHMQTWPPAGVKVWGACSASHMRWLGHASLARESAKLHARQSLAFTSTWLWMRWTLAIVGSEAIDGPPVSCLPLRTQLNWKEIENGTRDGVGYKLWVTLHTA